MDIKPQIESAQRKIQKLKETIKWLRKHRKALASLPDGHLFDTQLDFDRLSHPEVIKVVKALGGKWKKEKTGGMEGRVNYEQQIDGMNVRCWAGEPPPSCRMVEYEEVIPAHTVPEQRVKKFKMVCAGQAEPMEVALAQANSQPTTTAVSTEKGQ